MLHCAVQHCNPSAKHNYPHVQTYKCCCTKRGRHLTIKLDRTRVVHAAFLQVPLSVFKCYTTSARLNPKSVRARGAVALLNAFIYQLTYIPKSSSSLLASVQQQLQASGFLQQLPTLMQAAQEQLSEPPHSTQDSGQASHELQHAHLLVMSFHSLWKQLQPQEGPMLSFAAPGALLPAVMQLVQAVMQRIGVEAQQQEPEPDISSFCPMVSGAFKIVLTLMYDIIEEGGGQMPGVPGMIQVQLLLQTLPPLATIIAMAGLAGAMRADSTDPALSAIKQQQHH